MLKIRSLFFTIEELAEKLFGHDVLRWSHISHDLHARFCIAEEVQKFKRHDPVGVSGFFFYIIVLLTFLHSLLLHPLDLLFKLSVLRLITFELLIMLHDIDPSSDHLW